MKGDFFSIGHLVSYKYTQWSKENRKTRVVKVTERKLFDDIKTNLLAMEGISHEESTNEFKAYVAVNGSPIWKVHLIFLDE